MPDSTCFRLFDDTRDGFAIDLYGDVAVVNFYRSRSEPSELELAKELVDSRCVRSVYVKRRPREAKRSGAKLDALAPETPLWGQPVDALDAIEDGLSFEIRPANGLSVGLYLDARDARSWVRKNAGDRRVLNLFAYTCGFGVAAVSGGARRVLNLDVSRKVLDWGARNYGLNKTEVLTADFVAGDVFDWLGRLHKRGEQFDLVVADPPGFSTTHYTRFSAERDYGRLVSRIAPLLGPNAVLLAMCNVEQLRQEKLEAQIQTGLRGLAFNRVAQFGASAIDFAQPSRLKCLAVEIARRPLGMTKSTGFEKR